MITVDKQRGWIQRLLKQVDPNLGSNDQPWMMRTREAAIQAIAKLPALNRQHEAWRYTSIEDLLNTEFVLPAEQVNIEKQDIDSCLLLDLDAYRVVIFNGKCIPQYSDLAELPEGVYIDSMSVALMSNPSVFSTWFGHIANHTEHVFTALNTVLINDGVLIDIADGVHLDRPIELIYINQTQNQPILIQPRNLVVLGNRSQVTLIERFVGQGSLSYLHNNVTEISVGKDASLSHYRAQNENQSAYHFSSLYLSQGKNSQYHGITLTFGSALARTEYDVKFIQQGAECILNGLYVVGDKQLADFHLNINHKVSGCISREQFKGILYGKGHAVFDGHILVDKGAQQTDAHLTNDNLMLTRDAEVDTKPQLEIYADDIKCSHGTTVGQLDQQQIFYMCSRGISDVVARKLLCLGFAREIIDTINVPALHKYSIDKLTKILSNRVYT
jgi:Fe-S cluster assembly protein SufD